MTLKIKFQHIAALLVGCYFIVSCAGKILGIEQFVETFQSYGLPSFLTPVAVAIPPLELILGFLIILPATRKIASGIVFLLLIIFTGAFSYAHFFRGVEQCGCYGRFAFLDKNFSQLLAVNGALMILSAILFAMSTKKPLLHRGKILVVAVTVASVAGVVSAELVGRGGTDERSVYAQIITTGNDSTYALFFYEMDCPHCWNALGNVEGLQSSKVVDRVIGCTFGTDSSLTNFERTFHPNFVTHLIPVENFFELVRSVPSIEFVKNDSIIYSDEGDIRLPLWYAQHVFKERAGY
ncbi:MAG TPA: MauE/DoxX family redox-associated membrane protein [Candidatus Acidoferrales bacterium]|nr:MauE/DoxX family redox-associated membrane protein [Candidatus Acidoferrales bacterium]